MKPPSQRFCTLPLRACDYLYVDTEESILVDLQVSSFICGFQQLCFETEISSSWRLEDDDWGGIDLKCAVRVDYY